MFQQKPILVRAFELAEGGKCVGHKAIKAQLKKEGYTAQEITSHFHGKSFRDQLKALTKAGGAHFTNMPTASRLVSE